MINQNTFRRSDLSRFSKLSSLEPIQQYPFERKSFTHSSKLYPSLSKFRNSTRSTSAISDLIIQKISKTPQNVPQVSESTPQSKIDTYLQNLETKLQNAKKQISSSTSSSIKAYNQFKFLEKKYQIEKLSDLDIRSTSTSVIEKNEDLCQKYHDVISNNSKDKSGKSQTISCKFKYKKYYISEVMRAVDEKNSLAFEHVSSSIYLLKLCENYHKTFSSDSECTRFYLPPLHPNQQHKKTLVLDLDQTLIHCFERGNIEPDMKIQTTILGQKAELQINIRPYALSFLKNMSKKYQIVIFTAGLQEYADAILNQLDPQNEIFSFRLYRQHCRVLQAGELYVKDLSLLNRDLSKIVLVDNAAHSYAFQPENGIPILPFLEGKDNELYELEDYLNKLANVEDVRVINYEHFKLHAYTSFEDTETLIKDLYIASQQRK